MPKLELDEDKSWHISLIRAIGVFLPIEKTTIIGIHCNMIERDSSNPEQYIGLSLLKANEMSIDVKPTFNHQYKLRFHDFSQAEIQLLDLTTGRDIQFVDAIVQLEITEAYGRF